ncbi:MAG: PilZ domain-containing protein [Anaerolineales bacterium]|nr:PilZ domain-containing protein [Anaerolineales bacterium]
MPERRTTPRKKFDYYMRVDDDDAQKLLGHMVQVSAIGLQLETTVPLPLQKDYYLRLELTAELADHPFIIFLARTKWCKIDDIHPNLFHVGFQIMEITPEDNRVILNIIKKYGS